MNITCCICSELFVPSDDVHFTPCGHFFHFPCLSHWLERSKTCPQCRSRVTDKNVHRAYFTITSTDTDVDTTVLTSKIDSLNFQILLKDKDLKICGADNVKLKEQAAGLRMEVKKLELEINKHKSVNYAYKEQMKYLKEQISDTEAAKKEIVRLNKKLEEHRHVETLITGSQDEIDRMLSVTQDPASLVTYVSVMKREMEANVQRRRELRTRIRTLEQDINKLTSERADLLHQAGRCRQLEEDLLHAENEKKSLSTKLEELRRRFTAKRKSQSEEIHRFIAESPAPEKLKTSKDHEAASEASNCDIMQSPDMFALPQSNHRQGSPDRSPELNQKENSPKKSPKIKSGETSPYLSIKSQGSWGYSAQSQQRSRLKPSGSGLSILSKKPRVLPPKSGAENEEMQYDGFGGHSKVDNYPSPILRFKPKVLKNNLMSVKTKRRKLTGDDNKQTLENFFVDLT